jgi:uracil-DNA glycosylase
MVFFNHGKGTNGDLPPRYECAPLWHEQLLKHMKKVQFIILMGTYAQNYYLGKALKATKGY